MDEVLQALAPTARETSVGAIAQPEDGPHRAQDAAEVLDPRERPEIARTVLLHVPGDDEGRIVVPHGHFQVGIPLVVLQTDVVTGSVLLDEAVLEHERLDFGTGRDPVEVADPSPQPPQTGVIRIRAAKVGAHARTKPLRLAHVDDATPRIAEQIDAGVVRQQTQTSLEDGARPDLADLSPPKRRIGRIPHRITRHLLGGRRGIPQFIPPAMRRPRRLRGGSTSTFHRPVSFPRRRPIRSLTIDQRNSHSRDLARCSAAT